MEINKKLLEESIVIKIHSHKNTFLEMDHYFCIVTTSLANKTY